jgi:hypothetical protein
VNTYEANLAAALSEYERHVGNEFMRAILRRQIFYCQWWVNRTRRKGWT